jgi:hypothetical protein
MVNRPDDAPTTTRVFGVAMTALSTDAERITPLTPPPNSTSKVMASGVWPLK